MECDRLNKLYPLYVYDDVTDEERQLVNAHISGCEACATEVNELRKTLHVFRMESEVSVPQHFTDELEKEVYKQVAAETVRTTRRNLVADLLERFLFRHAIAWGASIAVALVIGMLVGTLQFSRTGTQEIPVPTLASSVSPNERLKQHFQTQLYHQLQDVISTIYVTDDGLTSKARETLERLSEEPLEPQMALIVDKELSRFNERYKGGI